jgi:hypothetical protein
MKLLNLYFTGNELVNEVTKITKKAKAIARKPKKITKKK